MKAQLTTAELKNKRLMEAFKKTSQELREVSYQLLGYRIDIPKTGSYRLMNMYAESQNDFFIFMVLFFSLVAFQLHFIFDIRGLHYNIAYLHYLKHSALNYVNQSINQSI